MLAQNEEMQRQNLDLQDRFASLSQTLTTSVGVNADMLLKENQELKAQLAVLPRLQEELTKRDAEVSDLRGAQQGLQTKYGDLEQKYASCLSEGTKLKQE